VVPSAPAVDAPTPINAAAASYPPMSLLQVLAPNNVFHDALFGVSVTYPEGWSVRQAIRWGQNNRENTVFFSPPEGSEAIPSMYYQAYPNGAPAPGNAEAMLREMAQQKEASRSQGGLNDYKNDPGSFVFREIDGHPALSYFATFTQGDQVQAEYFMRILGEKGYVMFFTRGPAKDVQALIPSVYQMGGTVKPP
jgi:hypothetical protein